MSESLDPVNYVVTGSRYQVLNEKGEPTPEFGVGLFRSGIRLDLAVKLYVELVGKQAAAKLPWDGAGKRTPADLAATAFGLSEVFLEEMDKHFRRPPSPPAEEKANSDRFKIS